MRGICSKSNMAVLYLMSSLVKFTEEKDLVVVVVVVVVVAEGGEKKEE